jgi:methionyl-tRNA synthetase
MEKTKLSSELISFEEFSKIDLRVGKITKAELIPQSRNLIKLLIDLGGGNLRQAVTGIAQYYSPKELEGKQVAVIVNLQPKRIFGVESNVMILAAEDDKTVAMLIPDRPVKVGSKIR